MGFKDVERLSKNVERLLQFQETLPYDVERILKFQDTLNIYRKTFNVSIMWGGGEFVNNDVGTPGSSRVARLFVYAKLSGALDPTAVPVSPGAGLSSDARVRGGACLLYFILSVTEVL